MVTKKDLQEALDKAIVEIIESISKVAATKEELKEVKEEILEVKAEVRDLKEEVRGEFKEVNRQINDLKADLPTPQEFANHEKRITKLEATAFPA